MASSEQTPSITLQEKAVPKEAMKAFEALNAGYSILQEEGRALEARLQTGGTITASEKEILADWHVTQAGVQKLTLRENPTSIPNALPEYDFLNEFQNPSTGKTFSEYEGIATDTIIRSLQRQIEKAKTDLPGLSRDPEASSRKKDEIEHYEDLIKTIDANSISYSDRHDIANNPERHIARLQQERHFYGQQFDKDPQRTESDWIRDEERLAKRKEFVPPQKVSVERVYKPEGETLPPIAPRRPIESLQNEADIDRAIKLIKELTGIDVIFEEGEENTGMRDRLIQLTNDLEKRKADRLEKTEVADESESPADEIESILQTEKEKVIEAKSPPTKESPPLPPPLKPSSKPTPRTTRSLSKWLQRVALATGVGLTRISNIGADPVLRNDQPIPEIIDISDVHGKPRQYPEPEVERMPEKVGPYPPIEGPLEGPEPFIGPRPIEGVEGKPTTPPDDNQNVEPHFPAQEPPHTEFHTPSPTQEQFHTIDKIFQPGDTLNDLAEKMALNAQGIDNPTPDQMNAVPDDLRRYIMLTIASLNGDTIPRPDQIKAGNRYFAPDPLLVKRIVEDYGKHPQDPRYLIGRGMTTDAQATEAIKEVKNTITF